MKKIIIILCLVLSVGCTSLYKPRDIYSGAVTTKDGNIIQVKNATVTLWSTDYYVIISNDIHLQIHVRDIKTFNLNKVN
ncbi:MAG: hypothetical protein JXN64_00325 [Spirochaetes bacterium]|nr:hypothetical protein [Spirochaetota bacterium]